MGEKVLEVTEGKSNGERGNHSKKNEKKINIKKIKRFYNEKIWCK